MGSVLVIISQFLNNSKRNARQPQPWGEGIFFYVSERWEQ